MDEKKEAKLKVDPRFNIFDKTQQDESIVSNNFVEFQISATTSMIEFFIGGHDEKYIDTRGTLYLVENFWFSEEGRFDCRRCKRLFMQ